MCWGFTVLWSLPAWEIYWDIYLIEFMKGLPSQLNTSWSCKLNYSNSIDGKRWEIGGHHGNIHWSRKWNCCVDQVSNQLWTAWKQCRAPALPLSAVSCRASSPQPGWGSLDFKKCSLSETQRVLPFSARLTGLFKVNMAAEPQASSCFVVHSGKGD